MKTTVDAAGRAGCRFRGWGGRMVLMAVVAFAAGLWWQVPGAADDDEPVRRWQVDDLAPLLAVGLEDGRDFAAGRRVFERARCARCHQWQTDRARPGPRLTGVGRRLSPDELLQAILEPDHQIDPRHAACLVTMRDGTTWHGVVVREDPEAGSLWLQSDLADPASVRELRLAEVTARRRSPISPMPAGLLDGEPDHRVLDLLAYVLSDADPDEPMFDRHEGGESVNR